MATTEKIEGFERQIKALRDPMRSCCERWLDATAEWAAALWQAKARSVVMGNHETTQAKGPAALADLKREVNSLAADARARAKKYFLEGGNAGLWPHLDEDMTAGGDRYYQSRFEPTGYRPRGPELLSQATAGFAALVGEALARHGYARPAGRSNPGVVAYREEWSEGMLRQIEAYAKLDQRLGDIRRDLYGAREAKAKADAASLWDQV